MAEGCRLQVMLRHRIGAVALHMEFAVTHPWTVLFAPSGAGKSTVLRIIAGLVRPEAGRVTWVGGGGQRPLILTDTDRDIFVSPHRRAIRYVGQQTALFPHMTVLENISYGLVAPSAGQLEELLSLCRVGHLAGKMPAMLSGGERQRVALARAIAPAECRVLLLDEPFSGLDVAMREELLGRLQPWLAARGVPVLQVTHDVGEVFALGAEVIRIEAGRVAAQGRAGRVLAAERERMLDHLKASGPVAAEPSLPELSAEE